MNASKHYKSDQFQFFERRENIPMLVKKPSDGIVFDNNLPTKLYVRHSNQQNSLR